MTPDNSIVKKLQVLQALAERAGTEHEAALAAQKIQELLLKHNLDVGVLKLKKQEGIEMPAGKVKKNPPPHWVCLATAVSELLDVEFFVRTGASNAHDWQYYFIGLPANVQAAVATFEHLIFSVESILEKWKKEPSWAGGIGRLWGEYDRKDYAAFRFGAAERIMREIRQSKGHQEAHAGSQEVMIIGQSLAKQMKASMKFERVTHVDPDVSDNHHSYLAGFDAGKDVNPHGVTSKRIKR